MGKNSPARQTVTAVQSNVTTTVHHGPLPQADEFKRYGEALPNAPDRILAMAEREQQARIDFDRHSQENQFRLNRSTMVASTVVRMAGQLFATGIIGGTIWVARDLLMSDRDIAGMTTLVSALAALAGMFMYRRRNVPRA